MGLMQPHFVFAEQESLELKQAYARALMRIQGTNRYYEAAVMVVGGGAANIGKSLWIASNWPSDPEVIRETQKLLRSVDLKEDLPSKEQAAMLAWEMANDAAADVKDRKATLELYCNIRGFIEKPGTNVTVPINIASNVMVVKDHGEDDEWERALAEQQDMLTNASASKH